MLFLAVQGDSTRPTAICVAERFPFTIGRSPSADFRIEGPGVWDVHSTIFVQDGRFHVRPEGQAILLIDDQPSAGAVLRVGNQLSIGSLRVSVSLAPAPQHGLAAREAVVWLAVVVVALAQLALLFGLR